MNAAPDIAPAAAPADTLFRDWKERLRPYEAADARIATRELIATVAPFALLWALAVFLLQYSVVFPLLLAIPLGGLFVRLFVIQHDCSHGSFFPSARANRIVGSVLGVVTLTPFVYWRRSHAEHHATSGNLERRGFGDVWTLTVREYQALPPLSRLAYRIRRNPAVFLIFGPLWHFVLSFRYPILARELRREERLGVIATDLAIAAAVALAATTIGLGAFLLVHLPVVMIAGAVGTWLFYVQHQFEDTWWSDDAGWDPVLASLRGSSRLDLPPVVRWFTASIELHDLHHLDRRIPFYRLFRCVQETPELREIPPLPLGDAFRSLGLRLWDEERRKLVGFPR
jgi:acyl-lipid omega-6 desaturase (Delta-12 desaturase)